MGVDWFIVGAGTDLAALNPGHLRSSAEFAYLARRFRGGPFLDVRVLASPAVRLARNQPASVLDHDRKVTI